MAGTPDPVLRRTGERLFTDRRALVMGILNVTPDSFSDGGADTSEDAAVARALAMVEAGADILVMGTAFFTDADRTDLVDTFSA